MSRYRVGLIGNPVEHSLSPAFQQAAFDALDIDARYELWHTEDDELPALTESLRRDGTLGANVTIPHKPGAYRLVDELSDRARQAGAVNTIINRSGALLGDNTDIPGFLAPLEERGFPFEERPVLILGAGGAARGIVVALLSAGCRRITIANRTVARAEELRDEFDHAIQVTGLGEDLVGPLREAALLVNSTAMGWSDDDLPIGRDQLALLPGASLVYDLTYRETAFLRAAAAAGHETIDGLPMLVHQGAESFRLWTSQDPPVDLMWRAAVEARRARA